MPKQSLSQAIGSEGERWFAAQLPSRWIPQLPTTDVGVDALVVICDDGPNNGLEFRVQVKSAQVWTRHDEYILVKGFRRSSLLDLLHSFTPSLLVLYEASSKSGNCFWFNQLVAKDPTVVNGTKKTVTLKVPTSRPVAETLWPQIASELGGVARAIGRQLALSGASLTVIEATHSLMRSLHLIDLCANGTGADIPENELIEAEMTAHKEIVTTLKRLHAELSQSRSHIVGIDETAERYVTDVESFFPKFREFIEHPRQGAEFAVAPEGLLAHRTVAMRAVTQIVAKLTRLSLESARAAGASGV